MTPTQERLYNLLKDGEPRTTQELFLLCVEDDLADQAVVRTHIAALRKKLWRGGIDIVFREKAYWIVRRVQTS